MRYARSRLPLLSRHPAPFASANVCFEGRANILKAGTNEPIIGTGYSPRSSRPFALRGAKIFVRRDVSFCAARKIARASCARGMPILNAAGSMLRAAPAGDDAVLVAQRYMTIRIFTGCGAVGRITDAGIGGDRDDLLNRGAGLVPDFDLVRQILPIDRSGPG